MHGRHDAISSEEFERLDFGADDVELLKGVLIRLPPPVNGPGISVSAYSKN